MWQMTPPTTVGRMVGPWTHAFHGGKHLQAHLGNTAGTVHGEMVSAVRAGGIRSCAACWTMRAALCQPARGPRRTAAWRRQPARARPALSGSSACAAGTRTHTWRRLLAPSLQSPLKASTCGTLHCACRASWQFDRESFAGSEAAWPWRAGSAGLSHPVLSSSSGPEGVAAAYSTVSGAFHPSPRLPKEEKRKGPVRVAEHTAEFEASVSNAALADTAQDPVVALALQSRRARTEQ